MTKITKKQYNYLLPALRSKLCAILHKDPSRDRHYFTGADVEDMWARLKGLSW